LITGLWQLYVYIHYHYTYLDWYINGGNFSKEQGSNFSFLTILKSLFAVLLAGWVFVPFAYKKIKNISESQKQFITLSLLPPFLFLFWGSVSSRLFYVVVPVISILVYLGTEYVFPSKKGRILSLGAILDHKYALASSFNAHSIDPVGRDYTSQ
jgi:hypothetical protein